MSDAMGFEASTGLLGELDDTASDRLDLSPIRKQPCDFLLYVWYRNHYWAY